MIKVGIEFRRGEIENLKAINRRAIGARIIHKFLQEFNQKKPKLGILRVLVDEETTKKN